MNPEDAAKIVDHLSTKDDRWLFLAMLVFVLAGGLMVIRYLVRRNEEQSKDHNSLVHEMVVVLHECKDVMAKVLSRLDNVKIALLLAATLSLTGCVTDDAGNTRFDAATFNDVTRTALDAYGRVNGYQQPVYPPGAPYPIYPPDR